MAAPRVRPRGRDTEWAASCHFRSVRSLSSSPLLRSFVPSVRFVTSFTLLTTPPAGKVTRVRRNRQAARRSMRREVSGVSSDRKGPTYYSPDPRHIAPSLCFPVCSARLSHRHHHCHSPLTLISPHTVTPLSLVSSCVT